MTRPHRLFVAVWPSSAVRVALGALDIEDGPAMRAVPPANWHVTLRFLGSAEPNTVIDRLSNVELPRVDIAYGPAIIRFERGQTVVPVDGVEPLSDVVIAATNDLGEPPRATFVGHLTVGRRSRRARDTTGSALVDRPITAAQTVESVALVASELGDAGATYNTLATFPTT